MIERSNKNQFVTLRPAEIDNIIEHIASLENALDGKDLTIKERLDFPEK